MDQHQIGFGHVVAHGLDRLATAGVSVVVTETLPVIGTGAGRVATRL